MYRSDSSAAATMASSVIVTLWCASKVSRSPRRMVMVCSTVGSLTSTGWNRRSRAASFSMCFWYSLSVVAQIRPNLSRQHPLRQPFHDGRLAHARLADQDRVVLLPAGEDLDHRLDLLRAADHGIELALLREGGEIAAVLVEVGRVALRLD